MRSLSDGWYSPRVKFTLNGQELDEVRVNNRGGFQSYTITFDNPTVSSSHIITAEYQSGRYARSVEILQAEVLCPIVEDQPGLLCAGEVCGVGATCCPEVNSSGIPVGEFSCADQCPANVLSGAMCDGHDDCGEGSSCVLSIGNFGGGYQCSVGSVEELVETVHGLVLCGTANAQTASCPENYVCERGSGDLGYRHCVPQ